MELRKCQQELVDEVLYGLAKSKTKPYPILAQAATGYGKSIVIAELATHFNTVLILSPTKEITEQNYDKLIKIGVPKKDIAICSASLNSHKIGRITLGTIGTVNKYYDELKEVDVVILDEAHVVPVDRADSQYIKFLDKLNTNKIVGLSATVWRNQVFHKQFELPKVFCRPLTLIHMEGGKKTRFGEWFWSGGVVYRCGIKEMQDMGYLAPVEYILQDTDWSFLSEAAGRVDYDEHELGKWSGIDENRKIFERVLDYVDENYDRTLVFTPNIDSSQYLCKLATMHGIPATTIDSKNDSKKEREEKLKAFRDGKIKVVFNTAILTTGYDLPALDCVVEARPTKSLSLYVQMIGRCLRIDPNNPDKVAMVIDLANNLRRFGRVEDIHLTQLDAVSKKTGWKYKRESIVYKPYGNDKFKVLDRVS